MQFKFFLPIILILFFTACSEESQIKEPLYTGTFVDAPVVGLTYICSSSSDLFQTDANGKFTCPVWETVKFQLNDLLIGTASATQDIVTPYSLSPDDSLCAVNIARLLQTLDTHLEEGVLHLNKDLLKKIPSDIDCSSPSFTEDVEKALNMKLVTAKDAKKSMDSSIIDHGGDVPSTPTLAALQASVDENASADTLIGVVSIIDKGTTEITSIQLSGLGNENFSISSTGEVKVTINATLDYETTTQYTLSAIAINNAGSSNNATITISILDINESKLEPQQPEEPEEKAPILESVNLSVQENSPAETFIGHLPIIDIGSTPITNITLIGNGNNNFFIDIDGNITVKENANLDFEIKKLFTLQAVATNSIGNSNTVDVNITIEDVNENRVPKLTDSIASIEENSVPNTLVGHINILDVGFPYLNNITLSGEGAFNFIVATDGNITTSLDAALDYETYPFYSLKAIASNSVGNSEIIDLNITVIDVNEVTHPVLAASSLSVIENALAGTSVGYITITSQGSSPINTFTLSGSGSNLFNVSSSGEITLATASLDYETTSSYNLNAIANTANGSSNSVNVNISVSNYINPFLIYRAQANPQVTDDYFGSSVDVSGDYLVVGTNSNSTEFVYLYKRQNNNTIEEIAKIKPNSGFPSDGFGYSVSISGDYILVGAPDVNLSKGAAYLFKRNSDTYDDITQLAQLLPTGPGLVENFGYSVSIDNDYMVIGRPTSEISNSGSVDLFKRFTDSNITELQQLGSSSGIYRAVGKSVSINGNYIIMGAEYDGDSSNTDEGLAYVFKIYSDTNTSQIARLVASDATAYDRFGHSVNVDNDYFIIGSFFDTTSVGTDTEESIYLFKRFSDTNISEINKIQSPEYPNLYNFGKDVAINGDYIIAGSNSSDLESAYIFQRTSDTSSGITQIKKIQSNNPTTGAYFANKVAIDTNLIILGAYNEGSSYQGAAYIFDLEPQKKPYIYNPISQIIRDEHFKKSTIYSFEVASPVIGAISYSIGGTDASHFSFSSNELSFVSTVTTFTTDAGADYEAPVDDNQDNNYSLILTATDSSGGTATTNLNIEIRDKMAYEVATKSPLDSLLNTISYASSIATDGNYTIVGAPKEDTTATDSGAAYFYYKDLNQVVTKIGATIKAPSGTINVNDTFGSAVAIAGDYIVIGAPNNDTNGSVFVYKRIDNTTTPQYLATLHGSASTGSDRFGSSVAIYDKLIAVGAPNTNDTIASTTNSGYTYLYEINATNGVNELLPIASPNQTNDNNFGKSISLDANYLLVGSNIDVNNQGHADLFSIDTLAPSSTKTADINASDGAIGDNFAQSLSLNGNYMAIGAPDNDANGSIYIFKKDALGAITEITKIHPNDVTASAKFGYAVSINEESDNNTTVVAIGAPKDSNPSIYGGRVYLYKINLINDNVSRLDTLIPNDAAVDYNFGETVSISGDNLSIGMKFIDTQGGGTLPKETAYIFIKDPNQP